MKARNYLLAAMLMLGTSLTAQTQVSRYRPGVTTDGAVYLLPKTALRIVVQIEKTTYTPGDFAMYAERYLSLRNVGTEPTVSYRVTNIALTPVGVADTTKCFAMTFNAKSAASNLQLSDDGILLAINAEGAKTVLPAPFVPAPKPTPINPRRYMSEAILAAGSVAKQAELTAQEIFDIRESKNHLTRGEADFMPQDGEQMKLMLSQLDTQDRALTQLFTGTVVRDTTEQVLMECPMEEMRDNILFRFSKALGLVERDNLAGAPYYITVEDLHTLPSAAPEEGKKKKKPHENGIYVNVPGRIRVSIHEGTSAPVTFELNAGQFGYAELLSGELFNKKYTTHVVLNPTTGGVEKMDAEQVR